MRYAYTIHELEAVRVDRDHGGRIEDTAAQLAYIVSAVKPCRRLRFTLKSHTGRHFTYQVKVVGYPPTVGQGFRRFVSVLTGSEYIYLGTIFDHGGGRWRYPYCHGKTSSIAESAESAKVWQWLWDRLLSGRGLGKLAEFWHEGTCGRCGHALTDPESIAAGQGPVCRNKGAC